VARFESSASDTASRTVRWTGDADVVDLIGVVPSLYATEVLLQRRSESIGKNCRSVRAALSVPHDDAALVGVQVLDPEAQCFREAQSGSVEQVGRERIGPRVHGGE